MGVFSQMVMKLLDHSTLFIVLENENHCMVEEDTDLQENLAVYLLS